MPDKRPPKPVYGWEIMHATTSRPDPQRWRHPLMFAIREKRLIDYTTKGSVVPLRAEPHVYGVSSAVPRVLVYHMGPERENDPWQLVDLEDIVRLEVLDETFPGKRPLPADYDPDNQPTRR